MTQQDFNSRVQTKKRFRLCVCVCVWPCNDECGVYRVPTSLHVFVCVVVFEYGCLCVYVCQCMTVCMGVLVCECNKSD